ncbi:MAG TPA: LamG-like jellyroll fold domain-containing protein [archaeon]|nr:LamG-like jellyroll fold domain-containing protein [archaeon]
MNASLKGQGSLEYLLLVGGAIGLVAIAIFVVLTSTPNPTVTEAQERQQEFTECTRACADPDFCGNNNPAWKDTTACIKDCKSQGLNNARVNAHDCGFDCKKNCWECSGALCCGTLGAHWSLDEAAGTTAADSSGNGNDGTLTFMDPATDWVVGQERGALDFDGADDYVAVGDDDSLDATTGLTLVAWVKPTIVSGVQRIITKGQAYSVYLDNTDLRGVTFEAGTQKSGGYAANFQAGEWYHVAFAYNPLAYAGNGYAFYVNGEEAATQLVGGDIDSTTLGLSIGSSHDGTAEFFKGVIDEPRVYTTALTAGQIRTLFEQNVIC